MENSKKNIITIIIIISTACLLFSLGFIMLIRSGSNEETNKQEENKTPIITNKNETTIDSPEEVIEMLNATDKIEGYTFVYKETNANDIIINQVNDETAEVYKKYIYNIKKQTFTITTYGTSSGIINGQ